jgi:hypothetical protein
MGAAGASGRGRHRHTMTGHDNETTENDNETMGHDNETTGGVPRQQQRGTARRWGPMAGQPGCGGRQENRDHEDEMTPRQSQRQRQRRKTNDPPDMGRGGRPGQTDDSPQNETTGPASRYSASSPSPRKTSILAWLTNPHIVGILYFIYCNFLYTNNIPVL